MASPIVGMFLNVGPSRSEFDLIPKPEIDELVTADEISGQPVARR
ncbi:hypothetical protein [Reyranella sp.]